jgi:predicted transcriptional regulator
MRFSVNVPDDLVAWLDEFAARTGKGRSAVLVAALRLLRLNVQQVQCVCSDPVIEAAFREMWNRPEVQDAAVKWHQSAEKLNLLPGLPQHEIASVVTRHRPYKRRKKSPKNLLDRVSDIRSMTQTDTMP